MRTYWETILLPKNKFAEKHQHNDGVKPIQIQTIRLISSKQNHHIHFERDMKWVTILGLLVSGIGFFRRKGLLTEKRLAKPELSPASATSPEKRVVKIPDWVWSSSAFVLLSCSPSPFDLKAKEEERHRSNRKRKREKRAQNPSVSVQKTKVMWRDKIFWLGFTVFLFIDMAVSRYF